MKALVAANHVPVPMLSMRAPTDLTNYSSSPGLHTHCSWTGSLLHHDLPATNMGRIETFPETVLLQVPCCLRIINGLMAASQHLLGSQERVHTARQQQGRRRVVLELYSSMSPR